jgi:hypothetical protein
VRAAAGGREEGDEDAEPERAAEVVCDVDQPASHAGVFCSDAGHAGASATA